MSLLEGTNLQVLVLLGMTMFVVYFSTRTLIHKLQAINPVTFPDGELTIRVNTYRRPDLLKEFLKNYHPCPVVKEITIVWSDLENKPPDELLSTYKKAKFEVHTTNSLSNRFKPLQHVPTDAVLSVDDDLVIPCEVLNSTLRVWSSNPDALVGYSPRMITNDPITGKTKYLRWQHTWWNGIYTIVLTKASILHKRYLYEYNKVMPTSMLSYIDNARNCEDIAMAHIVAARSKAAPVWTEGIVYEIGSSGISSGSSHFSDRGKCITALKHVFKQWPWVTGYQKAVGIDFWDLFSLWNNKM